MFNEWKMLHPALKSYFTDNDGTPLLTPDCVTASGLESEAKRLKKKIHKALADGLNKLGSN